MILPRPSELVLHQQLTTLATLIQERNGGDRRVAALIGRPAQRSEIPTSYTPCLAQNTYSGLPTSSVKLFNSLLNFQEHEEWRRT